jgi:hypothetical protein
MDDHLQLVASSAALWGPRVFSRKRILSVLAFMGLRWWVSVR